MRTTTLLAAGALAVTAACFASTGGDGARRNTGDAQRVDIRSGERYVDPRGGLEIQPILIEVNRATFAVRVDGIVREMTLTTGSLGTETIPPYTFELVSTSITPSATILITRVR